MDWQLVRDTTSESWVRAQALFTLATLIAYAANAMFHDLMLSPSEQWLLCLTTGVTVGLHSLALKKASPSKLSAWDNMRSLAGRQNPQAT